MEEGEGDNCKYLIAPSNKCEVGRLGYKKGVVAQPQQGG